MKLISSGATLAVLIGIALALRAIFGMPSVFLFLCGLTLLVAIYFVWASFEVGSEKRKMEFNEALTFAMPTLAEEQKVAILRALKDLEYEREVGKISEDDYRTVLAEYRERAKASILSADESLAAGREKALGWAKEVDSRADLEEGAKQASAPAEGEPRGPEAGEPEGDAS